MDKISIINLKIPARHGVYEFEKDKDGLFELDIELLSIENPPISPAVALIEPSKNALPLA